MRARRSGTSWGRRLIALAALAIAVSGCAQGPQNDPPTVDREQLDHIEVFAGVPYTIDLLENDHTWFGKGKLDPGSFSIPETSGRGYVVTRGEKAGVITYFPPANSWGYHDSITYTICSTGDGRICGDATAWFEVDSKLVAGDDPGGRVAFPAHSGKDLVLSTDDLVANDDFFDLGSTHRPETVRVGEPSHGALDYAFNNDYSNPESWTYRSDAGYEGDDSFTYWACAQDFDYAYRCDTATVRIHVTNLDRDDEDSSGGGGGGGGGGGDSDADDDGVDDDVDNCESVANADQADLDDDDVGDACDPDDDDDGVSDGADNCPATDNFDQDDLDDDDEGDVCDDDDDGDDDADTVDNCPTDFNPDQEDSYGDNDIGDVCDDFDEDGIIDNDDNCPEDDNPLQEDGDFNDVGDVCDIGGFGDTVDLTITPNIFGPQAYDWAPPAASVDAGVVTFNVTNLTAAAHSLSIDIDEDGLGGGDLNSAIPAGPSIIVVTDTATLDPGTYTWYCTIHDGTADAMEGTLTVV